MATARHLRGHHLLQLFSTDLKSFASPAALMAVPERQHGMATGVHYDTGEWTLVFDGNGAVSEALPLVIQGSKR